MCLEVKVHMNLFIKPLEQWFAKHPHLRQWGWFVLLWSGGLMSVMLIAYPIKFLVKLAS